MKISPVAEAREIRIGVFGHYGNRNLGDESIITAVIQNVKSRRPDAKVIGFSLKPFDTAARYRIPAYSIIRQDDGLNFAPPGGDVITEIPSATAEISESPTKLGRVKQLVKRTPLIGPLLVIVRRAIDVAVIIPSEMKFLKQSFGVLKGIDLLIISGSNQFLDNFGGAWLFPYNLLKWTVMAKMAGAQVAFASVGAGPLDGRLSKRFLTWTLPMAGYVSFRDVQSKAILTDAGYRGNGMICPDLAHSLSCTSSSNPATAWSTNDGGRPRVALNPMPIYDKRYWCDADDDQYEEYIGKLAEFSGEIVKEGYQLSFFSMQPRDANVIDDVISELLKRNYFKSRNQCDVDIVHHVDQLLVNLKKYDIVVATRFHGVLLSLLLDKPTVGICYGKKTEELLVDMGQGDYFKYFEDFNASDLIDRVHALEQNADQQVEKMREKSIEYRVLLAQQYDRILGLLDGNETS